jgi:hypothetical protein
MANVIYVIRTLCLFAQVNKIEQKNCIRVSSFDQAVKQCQAFPDQNLVY